MTPSAVVTVDTDSAGTYPEASEETLGSLVERMSPENSYLIVHRSDRPNDEYAQTALARDSSGSLRPGFVVEYRDGPNSQWQAKVGEARLVHELLVGWAFDRAGWKDLVPWEKLELGF